MKLTDYLKSGSRQESKEKRKQLADKVGVNVVYLSHLCSGFRKPSAHLANAIEEATGGQVTRKELRPDDFMQIWPDLLSAAQKKSDPDSHGNKRSGKDRRRQPGRRAEDKS